VDVGSGAQVGAAEDAGGDVQLCARFAEQRGGGVSQVVNAEVGQAGDGAEAAEDAGRGVCRCGR
jgi:hypothetical protein